jgi:hypothetical protein
MRATTVNRSTLTWLGTSERPENSIELSDTGGGADNQLSFQIKYL